MVGCIKGVAAVVVVVVVVERQIDLVPILSPTNRDQTTNHGTLPYYWEKESYNL